MVPIVGKVLKGAQNIARGCPSGEGSRSPDQSNGGSFLHSHKDLHFRAPKLSPGSGSNQLPRLLGH